MKSNTIATKKKGDTVGRQIEFLIDVITEAEKEISKVNNHRMRVGERRTYFQKYVNNLVMDGVNARRGKIYSPEEFKHIFQKDAEWHDLKHNAMLAIEKLRRHEQKLAGETD